MKYLITESQFNKVVFRYLDLQNYLVDSEDNEIRFYKKLEEIDPETEYPDDYLLYDDFIVYTKSDKHMLVSEGLIYEIMGLFGFESDSEVLKVVADWLFHTKNIDVVKSRPFRNETDIMKSYNSARQ
jgi:hypothetical protein